MKRLIVNNIFALTWCLITTTTYAVVLSPHDVAVSMARPQNVEAVVHATRLFDVDDFEKLDAYLDSLPLLIHEEALTVLVGRAADLSAMTPEREKFLVTLSDQQPTYLVKSQGNGYWVTMPAFNYSGEARWVLNHWQVKLLQDKAYELLNDNQLLLSDWLSFTSIDYPLRRDALVGLIPNLSSQDIEKLSHLYLNDKNIVWIRDNAILVALSNKSGSNEMYDLLWRRRTDSQSLAQLQKLGMAPVTSAHIEQMMAATINPVLWDTAIHQLAGLHPLPDEVKTFLFKQLGDRRRGSEVAISAAEQGNGEWLRQLQTTSFSVTRHNVEKGLDRISGQSTQR